MRLVLALFLTVFGWASAFIFIRLALSSYSPIIISFGRYSLAAIIAAIAYFFLPKRSVISIKDRLSAMACGMVGMGLYSYAVTQGEVTVSASITSFIINLMPLLAAFVAIVLYKEPLTKKLLLGFGISLIGLMIIALSEADLVSFGVGLVWLFFGLIFATAYTLLQKPVIKKMKPVEFICHALWGGALILAVILMIDSADILAEFKAASLSATFSIVYLALVPSILAFFGWSYALSQMPVAKAGLVLYATPLVTAILAYLILNEIPGMMLLVGMLLASLGTIVGSLKWAERRKTLNVTR